MTETADDLSAPLGQDTPRRKRRLRLPFTAMQALAVLLGLFLVSFAGFAIFNKDPLGGEPMTRIAINATDKAADQKPAAASHGSESKPEGKHETKDAPRQAGEQKFKNSPLATIRIPRTGGLAARPGSCRIIAFETTTYERDS